MVVGNTEPQDRSPDLSSLASNLVIEEKNDGGEDIRHHDVNSTSDNSIHTVLLHSPDILSNIFLFAAENVTSIPTLSLTCSHWNNTILSTSNASNDCLWQQICGVHYPDTLPHSEGEGVILG